LESFDIAVIGAGAAGLLCAGIAGQRGARTVLIDHSARPAEKIRISGGGRCNFTNVDAHRLERYLGADSRFARDALRAYPPQRFIELVRRHGIDDHEKHRGQLFCDDSSERIITMLFEECRIGRVRIMQPCSLSKLRAASRDGAPGFELDTSDGMLSAHRVVIATGGLSIPKIGATDLGYRIARQFGIALTEPQPGLVPLTFDAAAWAPFIELAGVALEVELSVAGAPPFREDLLFTHRGLSGPAILQISSYWRNGQPLKLDLGAGRDLSGQLISARDHSRQQVETVLATLLPKRLATGWLGQSGHAALAGRKLAELGNRQINELVEDLRNWQVLPSGTEGYRKAEVTVGGVATRELDPGSFEATKAPGLHFIGEVVDVTGWLGGYNFQWAWSSAYCAAMAMTKDAAGGAA
jgi:predicted Rossmann fold flavoprotein